MGYGPGKDGWFLLSPSPLEKAWLGSRLPMPVAMRLAKSEDGRLVCVGLKLGADAIPGLDASPSIEITARMLRKIPLGKIVDDLAALQARRLGELEKIESRLDAIEVEHGEPRTRRGPRGHAPSFWAGIAATYREALLVSPRATARYVAEHALDEDGRPVYAETRHEYLWQDRERVARKWIKNSREKGFLGPARPGRAGEFFDSGPTRESGQKERTGRREKP